MKQYLLSYPPLSLYRAVTGGAMRACFKQGAVEQTEQNDGPQFATWQIRRESLAHAAATNNLALLACLRRRSSQQRVELTETKTMCSRSTKAQVRVGHHPICLKPSSPNYRPCPVGHHGFQQ